MEEKLENKAKYYKFLIFACVGLYMAMMALKNVYVAEIATIIRVFGSTKSDASMMNTYYFVTYAITQFFLGFLIHKFDVKKYLLITIPLSVFTYVILALVVSEVRQMWWLFLVNGFAQAGVVASTKLTLGKYLPQKYTAKANAMYSLAYGLGYALSYGFSAICIEFLSWKVPFLFLSAVFLIMLGVYIVSVRLAEKNCPVIKAKTKETLGEDEEYESLLSLKSKKSVVLFVVVSMFIALFGAAVRYAINNWLVTYLHEVFGFPESLSMLVMIVVESMGIIAPIIMIAVCDKKRNYIKVMIAFYTLPFLISLVMVFAFDANMILSIVLLLVLELCLLAGNAGVSVMSFDMRMQINMGATSAFTNTTTSMAAGVVPTMVIALVEKVGWQAQYIFISCMLGLLLVSLVLSNLVVSRIKKSKMSEVELAK